MTQAQILPVQNTKHSGFDQTQLLAYADQYKDVILEKKDLLGALKDRYEVYLGKLKELGVDLSAHGL